MMTRRMMLGALCAAAAAVMTFGCGSRQEGPPKPKVDAKDLLGGLQVRDNFQRRFGAARLAELSAEELRPIEADLKKAIKNEKDPGVKEALQTALKKTQ